MNTCTRRDRLTLKGCFVLISIAMVAIALQLAIFTVWDIEVHENCDFIGRLLDQDELIEQQHGAKELDKDLFRELANGTNEIKGA